MIQTTNAAAPPRRRAPLRISQVLSACSFCKTRKIKCDGVAPACGGCVRFGRAAGCSLSSSAGASQGKDYPTYLRHRLEKLQRQLHSIQDPQAQDRGSSAEVSSGEQATRPHRPGQQATIDNSIADIGALPILASLYSSSDDGLTLSNVLLGAAMNNSRLSLDSAISAHDGAAALPKKDVAAKLAQHYIDHVYPRLPFFSIQGFWAQFNLVYSTTTDSGMPLNHPNGSQIGADTPRLDRGYSFFSVLLVLALSSSSLSRSSDSIISSQALRLFNQAMGYRESAVLPNSIVGVQSLLFLIQFATLNPSILDAWYLIGVGMRTCIDLGLHRDPQPLESVTPSLLETRRRLWWSMYSLDRSMSMGCGRPVEISDSVIDAQLPTFRIESIATEEQIKEYLLRYRGLQLQSLIYNSLSRSAEQHSGLPETILADLSSKLAAWRADTPSATHQALLESEWLMSKLLLHRPCDLVPERSREDILQLWESSRGFVAIYRQLVEQNGVLYVAIGSEKAYWVGIAVLYSAWKLFATTPTSQDQDDTQLGKGFDLWRAVQDVLFILRTLSERWEDGKLLAKKFETLSGRVIELVDGSSGSTQPVASLPPEVANFGQYVSLTSIWAASRDNATSDRELELQRLVSDMVGSDFVV